MSLSCINNNLKFHQFPHTNQLHQHLKNINFNTKPWACFPYKFLLKLLGTIYLSTYGNYYKIPSSRICRFYKNPYQYSVFFFFYPRHFMYFNIFSFYSSYSTHNCRTDVKNILNCDNLAAMTNFYTKAAFRATSNALAHWLFFITLW